MEAPGGAVSRVEGGGVLDKLLVVYRNFVSFERVGWGGGHAPPPGRRPAGAQYIPEFFLVLKIYASLALITMK